MAVLIVKQLNSKAEVTLEEVFGFELRGGGRRRRWLVGSDKVPGPLDGTAEHHAEDHPKDLQGGKRKSTSCHHAAEEFHSNDTKERLQT